MEHIKYTIESLADINIHQGVTKDDISYFEIKEKNCLDAFQAISSSGDDRRVDEYNRLEDFDELIEELIQAGAKNWAIKLCIGKLQCITKSVSHRQGREYAVIIHNLCELKQLPMAEEVLEIALKNDFSKNVSEFKCYEWLGIAASSKKRLNNKTLGLEIFKKAENSADQTLIDGTRTQEGSFRDFNSLADSIADEDFLGDKNYAKKVYQKAENLAESFKDFLGLGQSYGFSLGDKNLARKAFEKAEKLAKRSSDKKWLAESVAKKAYLGDSVWEKQLLEKKKKKKENKLKIMGYQINCINGVFEEGKLALAVLQDYCSKNECTFNELKEIFPDEVQGDKDYIKQKIGGNTGVFDTLAEAKDREDYFALLDPITIKDATIVVSTCWGERNLPLFIEKAEAIGYTISLVAIEESS